MGPGGVWGVAQGHEHWGVVYWPLHLDTWKMAGKRSAPGHAAGVSMPEDRGGQLDVLWPAHEVVDTWAWHYQACLYVPENGNCNRGRGTEMKLGSHPRKWTGTLHLGCRALRSGGSHLACGFYALDFVHHPPGPADNCLPLVGDMGNPGLDDDCCNSSFLSH